VLALTIVNHPQILIDEYDHIADLDFENRDIQKLRSAVLSEAAMAGSQKLSRETLIASLEAQGFSALLKLLDQQVRNARHWTATEQAATEDARDAYLQVLALHQRSRARRRQIADLERQITDAYEKDDDRNIGGLLQALREVQTEAARLENQEAIIDGFGVLSGRVKGPAVGS
jgi:DNA primase